MILKELKKQSLLAVLKDEVPVGCIIIKNDKILSKTFNKTEKKQSILCHAELLCLKKAQKKQKNWRLNDCEIYVTLEPCLMCASAIIQSRIKRIYYCTESNYITSEEKELLSVIYKKNNVKIEKLNDNDFSKNLLSQFFKTKR